MKVDRSKELLHPHPTLTSAPSLTLIAFDIFLFQHFSIIPIELLIYIYIIDLLDFIENFSEQNNNNEIAKRDNKHSFRFNQNCIHKSTLSLSKAPIYARIVKSK